MIQSIKVLSLLVLLILCTQAWSQTAAVEDLRKGINFIPTRVYSAEEDASLLRAYKGLRVADVSDGMDVAGLPNTGLVDPAIQACWLDPDSLRHAFRGIAVTARYVPTQQPDRPQAGEEFPAWESDFYNTYSSGVYSQLIRPGTALVIDDVEEKDIGSIGSNNILSWFKSGAVGIVTDAGARDTDEIALEHVPLYLHKKGRGIRPGRNDLESVNRPVSIGGVLVCPGDVVVADGDGVIVVPRKIARQVADFARTILEKDKEGRRNLYKSLGIPLDQTVK